MQGTKHWFKVTLLFPLHDNDSNPFEEEVWRWWMREMTRLRQGFTDLGVVEGWWQKHSDQNRWIVMNVKSEREVETIRDFLRAVRKKFGNSGFVVGERGFGPATALDTVDAPILKPSAFGRGWDLGACVNGGVEGRAGDAPLPPKWLITMGLRQKNRFNECKACGCEPASNHMSGFGFSATDSDSGRRAHGSHERARSARKGRKKHVSVLPRPNRSPWIVVEQNHNGIGKLMVPAFQIYANMNVINDL